MIRFVKYNHGPGYRRLAAKVIVSVSSWLLFLGCFIAILKYLKP